MNTQVRKGIISIILLIGIDQLIKLVIYYYFMEVEFNLIGEWVYFSPIFNPDVSWFSAKSGINLSRGVHILLPILCMIWGIILGKKYYKIYKNEKWVVIGYCIALAGSICSIIDRLFWGTSLDYIAVRGHFIFDLKDVLVNGLYLMGAGICVKEYRDTQKKKEIKVSQRE